MGIHEKRPSILYSLYHNLDSAHLYGIAPAHVADQSFADDACAHVRKDIAARSRDPL